MSKILLNTAILSLFLSLFIAAQAHAAPLKQGKGETPDDNLYRKARFIIRGKVKQIRTKKSFNGEIVYTRATISVSEGIKGKIPGKTITVEHQEDSEAELSAFSSEAENEQPKFEKGEETLLFLTRSFWRKNIYYLIDGYGGKYSICPNDSLQHDPCFKVSDEEPVEQDPVLDEEEPGLSEE